MDLGLIAEQAKKTFSEFIERADMKKGQILVVGCSTSEVSGNNPGKASSEETAVAIYNAVKPLLDEKGIYLAAQCCEHLNRAIVVEREAVPFAEPVWVVPKVKAGGSFATTCYKNFKDPVVLEEIKADGGIDIGCTLIGMHLKKVAVPLRLENDRIGKALIISANTRPKLIGGERAEYK